MNAAYEEALKQLTAERDSLKHQIAIGHVELSKIRKQAAVQKTQLQKRLDRIEQASEPKEKLLQCDSLTNEVTRLLAATEKADSLCAERLSLFEGVLLTDNREVSLLTAQAKHWEITAHAAITERNVLAAENENLQRKWKRGKVMQRVLAAGIVITTAIIAGHYGDD